MHHNILLPDFLNCFIHRNYEFDTLHQRSFGGRDFVKNKLDQEIKTFVIRNARLSAREFIEFARFFRSRGGALASFNFFDQFEHHIEKERLCIGSTTNMAKKFKLIAKYDCGFQEIERKILQPKHETIKVFLGGEAIAFRFIEKTMEIEIENIVPPGVTLELSCDYYTPVRFITPSVESRVTIDGSIELNEIIFREVTDV